MSIPLKGREHDNDNTNITLTLQADYGQLHECQRDPPGLDVDFTHGDNCAGIGIVPGIF
jgi:hypothetical protein